MEIENLMIAQKGQEKSELEIKRALEEKIDLIKAEWDDMYKTYYKDEQYEDIKHN